MRLRRGGGAVLSSRAAPHPHPLRHAASAAFALLASSRFASLARSALRALESPLREGGACPGRVSEISSAAYSHFLLLRCAPTPLYRRGRGAEISSATYSQRSCPDLPRSWFIAGGPKSEGGEAGDESWLGGERRRGARGEADADAGRRETLENVANVEMLPMPMLPMSN